MQLVQIKHHKPLIVHQKRFLIGGEFFSVSGYNVSEGVLIADWAGSCYGIFPFDTQFTVGTDTL